MEVMAVSRPIMEKMDAFKGCKPVVHSTESVIIRGKTHNKVKPENMYPRLLELFNELNIEKIEKESEKARKITDQIDSVFRKTEEVYDESNGLEGIERLKKTFEMTGFHAEYAIGQIDDLVVYVVLYMDKSGFGPMFVETMVIRYDESSL
ncbi:MAG: hypothetical protein BZ135_03455 [Methanosphaera sp. rholeuAM6]|nr:MAG: hypothetical protein BZ135_03455 [Methanosphaera sp. rholeuAM6]